MKPARWLHIALTALLLAAGFGAWAASVQAASPAPISAMAATQAAMQHDCCEGTGMACCQNGHDHCSFSCAVSHCTTTPAALVPTEPLMPQPVATPFSPRADDTYTSRFTPPLTPPPLV